MKEALKEQELKVAQIRNQLEVAQPRYEKANELYQKLVIEVEGHQPSNQEHKRRRFSEIPTSRAANLLINVPASVVSEDILSVSSSQANGKNVSQEVRHHSSHHMRQKVEDDTYISQPQLQQPPPPPPFSHPDTFQPPPHHMCTLHHQHLLLQLQCHLL
ncbi:hypothetical protein QOZ80_1AG0044960 [Eleusine coracana subsp. coracana]|nr:hypothetical protein QOZ80_1AG0044960 [Eleusine coracana subsp. coracana]